jgi:hypothetical protein
VSDRDAAAAVEQIRRAAGILASPTPHYPRDLSAVLVSWLGSVLSRSDADSPVPDLNYALEVAQLAIGRHEGFRDS